MRTLLIAISACCLWSVQACREGCTNADAINYDNKAKSDDGTCMHCTKGWQQLTDPIFVSITDNSQLSPFQGDLIFRARVLGYKRNLEGNGCGMTDYVVNDSCTAFEHSLQLINVSTHKAKLNGIMRVGYAYQGIKAWHTYNFNSITVNPGDTLLTDKTFELCLIDVDDDPMYLSQIMQPRIIYEP